MKKEPKAVPATVTPVTTGQDDIVITLKRQDVGWVGKVTKGDRVLAEIKDPTLYHAVAGHFRYFLDLGMAL